MPSLWLDRDTIDSLFNQGTFGATTSARTEPQNMTASEVMLRMRAAQV